MKRLHERQGWTRETHRLGEPREKLGESIRHMAYRATHGEFNPHARAWVLIFLSVSIVGGVFIIDQGLKNPGQPSPILRRDPIKPIWYQSFDSKDLSGWNTRNVTYDGCGIGDAGCPSQPGNGRGMAFAVDANHDAIAITKSTLDLSTASSKVLMFMNNAFWTSALCTSNFPNIFLFLTRNATLPKQLVNYNPLSDVNIGYVVRIHTTNCIIGTLTSEFDQYEQRDSNVAISNQGDIGMGCGSPNFCPAISYSTGDFIFTASLLNYTGTIDKPSKTRFQVFSNQYRTDLLPRFRFVDQYYFGVLMSGGTNENTFKILGSYNPPVTDPYDTGTWTGNSMTAAIYVPNPANFVVPAQIDTGGFFGPVIKALISIGVFIAQSLIIFINWLINILAPLISSGVALFNSVIVAIFNALGSLFGDSNLGTQISQFFSNVATFLSNVFANAIALLGNIVDMATKSVSFLSGFLANNSFTTLLVGFFGSLANVWTILNGIWGDIAKWFVQGSITAAAIMEIDWAFGTLWTAVEGTKGFKEWLDINEMVTLRLFNSAYWFFKESTDILSKLWMAVKGRVSPVEVAGTG